ncbi:MAG: ABC transporter substrate-binding protein [Burkholderiaceae bacterium]
MSISARRILLCCLCCAIPFFGSSPSHAETIRIGVSGPFSGGSKPMGESMLNGIRLATDEINAIGGINGKPIELVVRDDEASPELGARIADELTRSKVVATIGIVNTGVGLASIDIYQKARIPLMIAVSTGSSLTRKYAPPAAAENYIFRVSPSLDLEAKAVAADLRRKGLSTVAILADATAYGEAGLKAFLEQAKSNGIRVVSEERFKIGDQDMSAQMRRARATDAQAIVVWGIGPELAAIAHNKDALGWKVPLLGSWTLSMRNFIEMAGKAGEHALMPQTFIQDATSTTKTGFLLAYQRNFKTELIPSPMSAAQGYDGMRLLYLALRQGNSTDGSKIREAFENLGSRYQGVITSYSKPFSRQDHDAITENMLLMGQVVGGRVDYAYADDWKRSGLLRLKGQ